jgi:hypothetical protein
MFKTRDNPQKGCFSTARRPQKGEKLPLFYLKAYIIQSLKITEGFCYPFNNYIASFQYITSSLPSKQPAIGAEKRPSKKYNILKGTMRIFRLVVNRFWGEILFCRSNTLAQHEQSHNFGIAQDIRKQSEFIWLMGGVVDSRPDRAIYTDVAEKGPDGSTAYTNRPGIDPVDLLYRAGNKIH